ncbi:hypothetical protein ACHWQZ_G014720 [Mnemiopsis leidyi]
MNPNIFAKKLAEIAFSSFYKFNNTRHDLLNIPKEEFRALKELSKNSEIVIMKPDKGSGIVILNRSDYIDKMMDIIGDTTKFKLAANQDVYAISRTIETRVRNYLRVHVKNPGLISEDQYTELYPNGSHIGVMYGLPKVHKRGNPMRPICSAVGTATYQLGKFVAKIIQPTAVSSHGTDLNDTFQFVSQLRDLDFQESIMASFDVQSLFTNVPLAETIDVCMDKLYRGNGNIPVPNLPEQVLRKLLSLCVCDNIFVFNGKVYSQIDGVAMGSSLGQRGCSTEAALHKVTHMIERLIAKKGYVLGVFLDMEAAFDNVSFKAIANALSTTKLDPATAHWITNMVATRHITINHKDSTKTIRIKRGCPQGGTLSPFLWNLVIDDLLNLSPKDTPGYLQAFADDIVSLAEGNDLDVIWDRTQKTLNTIVKWCTTKDLTISALKTKVVMFTWNKRWNLRPIVVDNTTIKLSTSAKFLGITLDIKLNYNKHINSTTKKATASLMQCGKAVGPTWGLTPKTCIWIYKTIIRPIITYCCSIWIRATHTNINATKLRRVQPLALRIMTGAMPSTPFVALNQITNTTDIIPFLQGEAAKSNERPCAYGSLTRERPEHTKGTIKAHVTINNDFVKDLSIPHNSERDLTVPSLNLQSNVTTTTPGDNPDTYRTQLQNIINETSEDWITCYTDGSKTEDGCGAGYIITTNNNNTILHEDSLNLPNSCTVYQAELTATIYACRQLTNYTDKHIIIWTDSLSSINSLTTLITKNNRVKYCLDILNQIGAHNQVELRWIAAHSGLWGNERADELAKHGTTSTTTIARPIPQA